MSNDGLSNDEIIRLLFKNYMNFTSTSDGFEFYEETNVASNPNIFNSNILADTPSTEPNFTQASNDTVITSLTNSGFNVDDAWVIDKSGEGNFKYDVNDGSILRFDTIKLDYVGNSSAAFVCYDNDGNNVLKNLIPSNYASSGYSMSLFYNTGSELKTVLWLASRSTLSGTAYIGTSVGFGGALFDAKSGVITFYDVNGDANDVFGSAEFYLSATKYVGATGSGGGSSIISGVARTDQETTFISAVTAASFHGDGSDLSGVVTLDTSNNINVYGDIRIMSGGNLIVEDAPDPPTSTSSLHFNGLIHQDDVSSNPGTLRFNNESNLFEYYTNENIWNSLSTCKAEQPPYLRNVIITRNHQTIRIDWDKFNERFEDAYDGKIYPIYFQTYVDI